MARSSILFVAGGADVMQAVFEEHGLGYWSAAFDVALEKQGWLDYDRAEPDILGDPDSLAGYDLVIVAWLPADRWEESYVRTLRGFDGVFFLEGPLPDPLKSLLGLRRVAGEAVFRDGLATLGETLRSHPRARTAWGLQPRLGPVENITTETAGAEPYDPSSYSGDQLKAWSAAPHWVEPCGAVAGTVELAFETPQGTRVGVSRRGKIVASTFQILGYVAYGYTVPPLSGRFERFAPASGNIAAFEEILFYLLGHTLARHDRGTLSVGKWPWDADYCLTIRHDVDRIPDEAAFERLLLFEQEHALAVSWFWLPDRLHRDYIERAAEAGHEIALHAYAHRERRQELALLDGALPGGTEVVGEALHGGGEGFLGDPSIRAAARAGLLYTGGWPHLFTPSPRYPWIDRNGEIRREDIVGMPYTASTDTRLLDEEKRGSEVLRRLVSFAHAGWSCQILNHPDINFERLESWVASLDRDRAVQWTCAEIARWIRRTHRRENLRIGRVEDHSDRCVYELAAADPVEDLELCAYWDPARVERVCAERDGEEEPLEWRPKSIEELDVTAIRLSLDAGETVRLVVERSRSPRRGEPGFVEPTPVEPEPEPEQPYDPRAAILFVAGDEEVMRDVYRRLGMAYWSSAFDVVLEKHGWLDFDRAGPEVLAEPERLRRYDAVLVAWLRQWKMSYLRGLRAYDGVLFLEGPLPPLMEGLAGIERVDGERPFREASIRLGETAGRFARTRLHHVLPDTSALKLAPKAAGTRAVSSWLEDVQTADAAGLVRRLRRIAVSYALAYAERLARHGQVFPNPFHNALAALAVVRLLHGLQGPVREKLARVARSMLEARSAIEAESAGGRSAEIRGAWAAALAEAAVVLEDSTYAEDARATIAAVRGQEPLSVETRAWLAHAVAALEDGEQGDLRSVREELKALATAGPDQPRRGHALLIWLLAASNGFRGWLKAVAGSLESDSIAPELEGWRTPDLLALAGALVRAERPDAADYLYRRCLVALLDEQNGTFRNGEVSSGELGPEPGHAIAPAVLLALVERVRETEPDGSGRDPLLEYDPIQVKAWAAPAYRVVPFRNVAGIDELSLDRDGVSYVGLVRRGRVLATSFQLLGHLVHFHTLHPLARPPQASARADTLALEHILFHLLETTLARYRRPALTVAAWPYDADACLSVRHCVGEIPEGALDALLAFEQERSLGVTWFWTASGARADWVRRQLEAGHEVALQAVAYGRKDEELAELEGALPEGVRIQGEAYGAGDGSLGHPSVAEAVEAGLLYTEAVPSVPDLPYAHLPGLAIGGIVFRDRIVNLTATAMADARVGNPDAASPAGAGGFCQVVHDPGSGAAPLQAWMESLPSSRRVSWACEQVARWWSATHRRDRLSLRRVEDGLERCVYELSTRQDVEDLELRTQIPPDHFHGGELEVDGVPGPLEWEPVEHGTFTGIRMRVPFLPGGQEAWLRLRRKRPGRFDEVAAAVPEGGLRTDPTYQLTRVTVMAQLINRCTPIRDLQDVVVGDVGCGYGPFTLAFRLAERPARLIGVDLNPDSVELATRLAETFGIEETSFVAGDMVETDRFVSGVDLLVVNNSIYYLERWRKYKEAFRAFHGALRPGGVLVVLTPNRIFPRDPFTGLVGVQWLPELLATPYARMRGKRDTYGDVRMPTPLGLAALARRTGFEAVQVINAYTLEAGGWKRFFKPRFFLTAIKPADER